LYDVLIEVGEIERTIGGNSAEVQYDGSIVEKSAKSD
jgi:hypothetical protein